MNEDKLYAQLCTAVEQIAIETGKFILEEQKKIDASDVLTKSNASFVTYVDKQAEAMIVDKLKKLLPEAGFVTEEGTAGEQGESKLWIIDPLDGTTNYIHRVFPSSVSIALTEHGEPVVGVVYEIGQKELFSAFKGGRATLNHQPIQVSVASRSEDALIGTGFPYYDFDRLDDYIGVLRELMQTTRGLRRFGSAAVDLCYVACGRFDAFFEHALHPWDVAAGAFIIEQAGGRVTDFNGKKNWLFGGEIIAASNNYFDTFYSLVNSRLGYK